MMVYNGVYRQTNWINDLVCIFFPAAAVSVAVANSLALFHAIHNILYYLVLQNKVCVSMLIQNEKLNRIFGKKRQAYEMRSIDEHLC